MPVWVLRAVLGGLLLVAAGPGCGEPTQAAPAVMGPLSNELLRGAEGVWVGRFVDEHYEITNERSPGDIYSAYHIPHRIPDQPLRVSVQVRTADRGRAPSAGLIYALEPQRMYYYALILEPGQRVTLLRRIKDGFETIFSQVVDSIDDEGWNELEIVERTNAFELWVNREVLDVLTPESPRIGGLGIVAMGTGRFAFRGYALEQLKSSARLHRARRS